MTHEADPAVRSAIVEAARTCVLHGGTAQRRFDSAVTYAGDVVVQRLGWDDPRRCVHYQTHRIAIRVDLAHARAHGDALVNASDFSTVDAWLCAQEWSLESLWSDPKPVFTGRTRLGVDVRGKGGTHVITGSGHRMSLWFVFDDVFAGNGVGVSS